MQHYGTSKGTPCFHKKSVWNSKDNSTNFLWRSKRPYVAKSRLYAPKAMRGLRSILELCAVRLKTSFHEHTNIIFEKRNSMCLQQSLKTTMELDRFLEADVKVLELSHQVCSSNAGT
ncbi:unnamed protein product [Lepeophtheirus salmonis]|uniref:(salmon louse) hypothetical protein n=1 Tax=Lepeophtheirus salmonis TaxID=72036 RepID=A0A7R8CNW3_LEPSM|nr:unnamed protein product [Lepeophtheirus salmonis]CAF2878192.1 unnamed protein product [Lepeophtheirus salmonis]